MWNKIYTWYDNLVFENKNVKIIIGGLSMMLFTYLMIYLVDEIIPKMVDFLNKSSKSDW